MVAHFVTVLLTGFIIYTAWAPGASLFSWHPTFMAIAFMMLMFEGILMFSPQSSLVVNWSRSSKVTAHWICQTTGVVCALLGLAAIMYNKHLNDKPHFTTWHGLLGVMTVAFACFELLGGLCVKYSQTLLKGIKIRLADLKMYHATAGLVLFILACVTTILGMFSNFYTRNVQGTSYYMSIACVALISLIITNQVTQSYLPKVNKR
ncbi:hypothetical protein SNE40_014475 [Patella caerulea]|uniref:ascorbate ferrireductase (transmembrane) n=1 Tax=Patella caerulea TaxID=87958 RepID=A0AAN8JID8_PATCE